MVLSFVGTAGASNSTDPMSQFHMEYQSSVCAFWVPSAQHERRASHHEADPGLEELVGIQDPFIVRLEQGARALPWQVAKSTCHFRPFLLFGHYFKASFVGNNLE